MVGSHSILSFLCEDCNNFYQFEKRRALVLKAKYDKFLCPSCRRTYAIASRKNTNIKKYSATVACNSKENISKRDTSKVNSEKAKKTLIEKYGSLEAAYKERNIKTKETCLKKYGFENAMQNKNVSKKSHQIRKDNNGGQIPSTISLERRKQYAEQRNKILENNNLTWLDKDDFSVTRNLSGNIFYHFKCNICGNEFTAEMHSNEPICRVCNPYIFSGRSNVEKEMADYIKSIYTGKILENDRTLLKGKELDIYLPDLKIAFEMNGYYFHGYKNDTAMSVSEFKSKTEEKRLLCKENGVRLINIDDVDWNDRPDVFKRFIDDCVLPRKRVFARQCEIKNIDTKTAKAFCETYHVNGFRGGNTKLGLFFKDELIAVAIFGKHSVYENECIRLCYKTSYTIIGGWAKIQKHFGKKFLHYVNLKYFEGKNKTGCGYRMVFNKQVIGRRSLTKDKLKLAFSDYDDSISDFRNCLNHGFVAIFDCGNDIRIYDNY